MTGFFKWLYEWATVVGAAVFGGLSTVFELLAILEMVDLTSILPAAYAAKIITAIAIAKGLHAWYRARHA